MSPLGAQLKATVTVTRGREAFVSQHVGDLDTPAASLFLEETLHHMLSILEVEPVAIACDLHPDFPSSKLAHRLGLPVITRTASSCACRRTCRRTSYRRAAARAFARRLRARFRRRRLGRRIAVRRRRAFRAARSSGAAAGAGRRSCRARAVADGGCRSACARPCAGYRATFCR